MFVHFSVMFVLFAKTITGEEVSLAHLKFWPLFEAEELLLEMIGRTNRMEKIKARTKAELVEVKIFLLHIVTLFISFTFRYLFKLSTCPNIVPCSPILSVNIFHLWQKITR